MTNEEIEAALDFELDKSSVLCGKMRAAFEGLKSLLELKEAFAGEHDDEGDDERLFEKPPLFSEFLRQHGVAIGESGDIESKVGDGVAGIHENVLSKVGMTAAHPFAITRHMNSAPRSPSPPSTPTATVANVSGTMSVSKLLERLKRTQGIAN